MSGVHLASGSSLKAALVVVAAGAWTASLVPELASFYTPESQVETVVARPPVSKEFAATWPVVFFDTFFRADAGIYMEPLRKTANDSGLLKIGCHYRGLPVSHEVGGVIDCRT